MPFNTLPHRNQRRSSWKTIRLPSRLALFWKYSLHATLLCQLKFERRETNERKFQIKKIFPNLVIDRQLLCTQDQFHHHPQLFDLNSKIVTIRRVNIDL